MSAAHLRNGQPAGAQPPAKPEAPAPGQESLFDLGAVTHRAPDAEIRAALVAQGDTAEGRRRIFQNATIRQVTLAYPWEEHRQVVHRLKAVMDKTGAKNASEAVLRLLDRWEEASRVTA